MTDISPITDLVRFDVLGVRVHVVDLERACLRIADWISQRIRTYVCLAPVSTIVDANDNLEYRKTINAAGLVTPDGMPLVWLGRLNGHKGMARTYGPDLMATVFQHSESAGWKHYFYGGTERTNELLLKKLQARFPGLNIVGNYAPPFRGCHAKEEKHILRQIDDAQPDILWVGLGSPKQDFWMAEHRDQLSVPVIVGVGAAFDFLAGVKPQAPRWMQRSGLEWLFRLASEPRRLWKRYLIGNIRFLYLLTKSSLRGRAR